MDFETNFKKPFTDIKKLLIGILLSIVPIINFFSVGFMLETAKRAMKRDSSLPEWDNWGDLFIKGLVSIVIEALYIIPAVIIGMIFFMPKMMNLMPMVVAGKMPDFTGMLTAPVIGGLAIAGILALLAAYIVPSAIFHYLNGTFGDAFSFSSVFKKAFTGKYAQAWLLFMLYSMVLGGILGYIPYVGSAAASFIAGITGLSLLGEAFANAEMPVKKEAAPKKAAKKRK